MAAVSYPHIDFTSEGVAVIAGTQTKVIEVVLDRIAHHWDVDEIHRQHPLARQSVILSSFPRRLILKTYATVLNFSHSEQTVFRPWFSS
jgi:hypothetical protein